MMQRDLVESPDAIRHRLRRDLHRQRCQDNDHSISRLLDDALELDQRLKEIGAYQYPTMWGRSPK